MITFKIPTSIKEVKQIIKNRTDAKYKHNRKVISNLSQEVYLRIKDSYWEKDISEYYRQHITGNGDKGLQNLFIEALNSIK